MSTSSKAKEVAEDILQDLIIYGIEPVSVEGRPNGGVEIFFHKEDEIGASISVSPGGTAVLSLEDGDDLESTRWDGSSKEDLRDFLVSTKKATAEKATPPERAEEATAANFVVGNVVRLLSGGPAMTVESLEALMGGDKKIGTVWFDGGLLCRGTFLRSTLVKH